MRIREGVSHSFNYHGLLYFFIVKVQLGVYSYVPGWKNLLHTLIDLKLTYKEWWEVKQPQR